MDHQKDEKRSYARKHTVTLKDKKHIENHVTTKIRWLGQSTQAKYNQGPKPHAPVTETEFPFTARMDASLGCHLRREPGRVAKLLPALQKQGLVQCQVSQDDPSHWSKAFCLQHIQTNPTGEKITDKNQQLERWVEHYSELYATENVVSGQGFDSIENLPIMEEL